MPHKLEVHKIEVHKLEVHKIKVNKVEVHKAVHNDHHSGYSGVWQDPTPQGTQGVKCAVYKLEIILCCVQLNFVYLCVKCTVKCVLCLIHILFYTYL